MFFHPSHDKLLGLLFTFDATQASSENAKMMRDTVAHQISIRVHQNIIDEVAERADIGISSSEESSHAICAGNISAMTEHNAPPSGNPTP